jgi:hypothetical protein
MHWFSDSQAKRPKVLQNSTASSLSCLEELEDRWASSNLLALLLGQLPRPLCIAETANTACRSGSLLIRSTIPEGVLCTVPKHARQVIAFKDGRGPDMIQRQITNRAISFGIICKEIISQQLNFLLSYGC